MDEFVSAVRYLGYLEKDVKKLKPEEFFKQVSSFIRQVDACKKQKKEQVLKEQKKKEAEAKKAGATLVKKF